MSDSSVEPLNPNTYDIPKSINAEEITPIRKYLSAASFDFVSCLRQPASTNVGIEIVSSATKIEMRSRAEAMTVMPSTDVSSRT